MYYYTMKNARHDNSASYTRITAEAARNSRLAFGKHFPLDKPAKRELAPNYFLIITGSAYICEDCGKEFEENEQFFRLDNGSIYCFHCK